MIEINNVVPIQHVASPVQTEEKELWYDAIDYVELEERWFDACETLSAAALAEAAVPFTEDCLRCVKQLIVMLGDYKQCELLSCGLAKLFPGIPVNILFAADSLYRAMTQKRHIDIAVLHALGLTSSLLPDNMHMIAWVARYLRSTVLDYAGETFARQFLADNENPVCRYTFSILAIAAIAAGYWLRQESTPQRRVLQVPAFLANLLVRASHYWKALGNMAQPTPAAQETVTARPAFEIDTSVEITQRLPDATTSPQPSPLITAFVSNSTTLPEFATKATVEGRAASMPKSNASIAEQAHALAMIRTKRESGLAELLYCDTHTTETIQHQREHKITHTHFNTQCDATVRFDRHPQTTLATMKSQAAPATYAASAASNNDVRIILPLVTTAAVATSLHPLLQATGSRKALAASAIAGATTLILGGKFLLSQAGSNSVTSAPPPTLMYKREKREVQEKPRIKPGKKSVEKLILAGDKKKIFKKFSLQSDVSGEVKKTSVQKLINSYILSFGTKMFNSEGFFTLTLPRKNDAIKARTAGIVNALKKGMNEISFAIRINTYNTKTVFFRINGVRNTELFTMSKHSHKLIINHDGTETIINNAFKSLTNASRFEVTINKGTSSFITVLMDGNNIFSDLMEKGTQQYFIGIACGEPDKYFKSVDIKDVSRIHTAAHPLHTDWHNYLSVMEQEGIIIDREINPFTSSGLKFYGTKKNLQVRKSRSELVKTIRVKLRHKRSIEGEAVFTTVLNATSMAYLIRVLGDPKSSREEKELAIVDYLKTTAADAFSFSAGLVEHMDPFSIVSESYATGMKGLLKAGGAAVGIIFNAMNFINGVKENDIAKIVSATIGIAGAVAGVVLSGLTGFGVALFLLGLKLIADAISDAKSRGEAREKFFKQTILHKERNQLFHYTWMAKTNRDGHSDDRYNPFKLDNENAPGSEQKNDEDDKPLFYTMLTGDVEVTPEMVGSVDTSTTFNTARDKEHEGFLGFQTREKKEDEEITHLIYASHVMIPDTSYIGHENQGKDSILADGTLLKGDDTIVSGSINAKIDAGEGNDIIFVSGREEIIDGGAGANIVVIDGSDGQVTLNIYGDGDASLGSGTKLRNIGGFIITGKGHKVIINATGINNIVPIIVCQGNGLITLRNPAGNGQEAIVKEYGSKERVKTNKIFTYHNVLNRISMGDKTIAMQKGFAVKQVYDD